MILATEARRRTLELIRGLLLKAWLCDFLNAPFNDCAFDRLDVEKEAEETLQDGLRVHPEVLIPHEVSRYFRCDCVYKNLVIQLHIMNRLVDKCIPVFWLIYMELLIDL